MEKDLRILIVEDSEDDARLVLRQLERAGYRLSPLRVDTEAGLLAALQDATWDVIISDYAIPGFGGLLALATVRGLGIDVPFIIVSGTIGEDFAVEAIRAGAHDYVMKDRLQRLVPAIDRELREAAARRERRRIEQLLQESDRKYRQMFDIAYEGIWVLDEDHRTTIVNRRMANMLGYAPGEMTGRPLDEFLADSEDLESRNRLKSVQDNLSERLYAEFVRRDGSLLSATVGISPIRDEDGRYQGILAMVTDVTDLKKTTEALMISERLRSDIIDFLPDPTLAVDTVGRVIVWNKAIEKLTGVKAEDMLGKTDYEYAVPFYGERRPILIDLIVNGDPESEKKYAFLHRQGELLFAEVVVTHLPGEPRRLWGMAAPLYAHNGALIGAIETIRDVTDIRKAETSLRESEERFRSLVNSMDDMVMTIDRNLRITGVFGRWLEKARLTPDHFLGKTAVEILGAEGAVHDDANARALRGENVLYEWSVETHKGRRSYQSALSPLRSDADEVTGIVGVSRDISSIRQAQERIAFQAGVLAQVHEAVIAIDNQQIVTYWNAGAESLYGIPAQEMIGAPLTNSHQYLWIREGDERSAYEALERDGCWTGEAIHKKRTGEEIHVDSTVSVLKDEKGERIGLLAIIHDITQRRRMQQQLQLDYQLQATINNLLRVSFQHLSLEEVLEQSLDRILAIPWLHVEKRAAVFLRRDGSDTLEMKAQRGFPEELRAQCREVPVGRCVCGQAALLGKVVFTSSGHEVATPACSERETSAGGAGHGHYGVPILYDDRVIGVICLYLPEGHLRDERDSELLQVVATVLAGIIRRKQAEDGIREHLAFLEVLMDTIPNPIFYKDTRGRYLGCNRALERFLGRERKMIIGRTVFDVLPGEQAEAENRRHNELLAAREGIQVYETIITDGEGKERNAILNRALFLNADGSVGGVVGIVIDITERKRAELEREALQAQLVQRGKMVALGEMAAGVAHELNNPLTIIMGNAQYLLEGNAPAETLQTIIREIEQAAQRSRKIVADLLEFSRKKEMKFRECALNGLVDHALRLSEHTVKYGRIAVVKRYAPDLPALKASESQLEQVFLNIVNNAVQAMPEGGTLTIETAHDPASGLVVVRITDSGVGILPEQAPRVFDPFFTTKPAGTGLGLAVSYGIIKQHNGDIRAQSDGPGRGTTFTVTLPV